MSATLAALWSGAFFGLLDEPLHGVKRGLMLLSALRLCLGLLLSLAGSVSRAVVSVANRHDDRCRCRLVMMRAAMRRVPRCVGRGRGVARPVLLGAAQSV